MKKYIKVAAFVARFSSMSVVSHQEWVIAIVTHVEASQRGM